ncbi:MAG: LysM peptidoglycan-binding domain-containing protein, partial [Microscillaceae bacterium]|nr:LysM peptidoglycan-binding domain-containing protein [Microscillaceae bacterium]
VSQDTNGQDHIELTPGQKLRVYQEGTALTPAAEMHTHTVQKGETLYGIGKLYGIEVEELKKLNGLSSDSLSIGQELKIPKTSGNLTDPQAEAQKSKPESPTEKKSEYPHKLRLVASGTQSLFVYVVQNEILLYQLSKEMGLDYEACKRLNPELNAQVALKPNQLVYLPTFTHQVLLKGETAYSIFQKYYPNSQRNDEMEYLLRLQGLEANQIPEKFPLLLIQRHSIQDVPTAEREGQEEDEKEQIKPQPSESNSKKGLYPGINIEDKTASYKKFIVGDLKEIKNIILHRTDSSTASSTFSTYNDRLKKGSHIGAQYLIGQDGIIYLITPADKKLYHVVGEKNRSFNNNNSIGIENVGLHHSLSKAKDNSYEEMVKVRKEIKNLSLSPNLKSRLLNLSDKLLYNVLSSNGWNIYLDISGEQKRANWLLVKHLHADFSIDEDNVVAHESIDSKTIGEGENIKEFLNTMKDYENMLKSLKNVILNVPSHKTRQDVQSILEISKLIDKDKSKQHSKLSDSEEKRLANFFNNFYSHKKNLENLLKSLK